MTEKLYETDAYLSCFRATVVDCQPRESGYAIVLDRTAFFPEGGGQPGDSGYIDDIRVHDTQICDGRILHMADGPLPIGREIEAKIDFDLRFDRMQNHTGEHLVCGIAHSLFGVNNVGFHLGAEETTLDFDAPLTRAQLDRIEDLANEAVFRNVTVRAYYPDREELATLTYRAKLALTEGVRIVHIEGYDDCACCAPHVGTTGEIGLIKMLDFIHYKGGVRIRLLCGARALRDYRAKFACLAEISRLCCVPQDTCDAGVAHLLASLEEQKAENAALARALADARIAAIPVGQSGNLCFFESLLGEAGMRRLALGAGARIEGVAVVLLESEKGYRYCLAAKGLPLRALAAELHSALGGKGGGNDELISGFFTASRTEIERYFAEINFIEKK